MANVPQLMNRRTLLKLAFSAAAAAFVFFSGRAAYRFMRYHNAPDEQVEPWMSIGYAARAHGIDPRKLHDALGLPEGKPDFRPLGKIGKDSGLSFEVYMKKVNAAVEKLQQEAAPVK